MLLEPSSHGVGESLVISSLPSCALRASPTFHAARAQVPGPEEETQSQGLGVPPGRS